MKVVRTGDTVQIDCTANELASVLKDLWGHSMGMDQPGLDLTHQSRDTGIVPGLVNNRRDRCRDCGEYPEHSATIHTPGAPGYHPFR